MSAIGDFFCQPIVSNWALVIFTAAYVFISWKILKANKETIKAAHQQIDQNKTENDIRQGLSLLPARIDLMKKIQETKGDLSLDVNILFSSIVHSCYLDFLETQRVYEHCCEREQRLADYLASSINVDDEAKTFLEKERIISILKPAAARQCESEIRGLLPSLWQKHAQETFGDDYLSYEEHCIEADSARKAMIRLRTDLQAQMLSETRASIGLVED